MPTTMNLLETALQHQPVPYWTERLKLARTTLNTAKVRGHLSPAIAGALAEELGQDAKEWIVVAALESERDSACKTRMLKRMSAAAKRYFKNGVEVVARRWRAADKLRFSPR